MTKTLQSKHFYSSTLGQVANGINRMSLWDLVESWDQTGGMCLDIQIAHFEEDISHSSRLRLPLGLVNGDASARSGTVYISSLMSVAVLFHCQHKLSIASKISQLTAGRPDVTDGTSDCVGVASVVVVVGTAVGELEADEEPPA